MDALKNFAQIKVRVLDLQVSVARLIHTIKGGVEFNNKRSIRLTNKSPNWLW